MRTITKRAFALIGILIFSFIVAIATARYTWHLNNTYYDNQYHKAKKAEAAIISENQTNYINYALAQGKITITQADIKPTLNHSYNVSGLLNGQPVSVNVNERPTINNQQITLYKLTSNTNNYLVNQNSVRSLAFDKATSDRKIQTKNDTTIVKMELTLGFLRCVIVLGSIILFMVLSAFCFWLSLFLIK